MFTLNHNHREESQRVRNSIPTNLFGGIIDCSFAFALCLSVFFPSNAGAIEWRNDYTVSLTAERDDNFRLTEADPVETTSTSVFASGELRGEIDEVSNFQLGLVASTTTYSESSIEDSEDYSLFFRSQRRGERWSGSLDASFSLAPTTQTELLDTGNRIDGEREAIRVEPGINYQIDERNAIYLNLAFLDVNYDTVSLIEYTDNLLAVGWVNQISETSEVLINGTFSEFNPDNDDLTTITGFSFGYGLSKTEVTRYDLTLGYAEADTPEEVNRDGNSSFEFRYIPDERNSFSIFVGNGFEGSGAGEVRHESRLNLNWNHALAERAQLSVNTEGVKSDLRDYVEILVSGRYQYTRELSFEANYRYRIQHIDTTEADSNSILFSLQYSPDSGFRHTL